MTQHKSALRFVFAATLFASAALLFWVEPMVAKMLLPLLGGTPAVWNTCLLFFQSLLLAGYAYALFASRRLTLRQQIIAQAVIFIIAALSIPVRVSAATAASVPRGGNPSLWLLGQLLLVVGLPFFALSTLTPLLQRWYAATRHAAARDPYFLYAASNAGSLCALLAYPLALEPLFTLRRQSSLWAYAYAALALLVGLCGALAVVASPADARATNDEHADDESGARDERTAQHGRRTDEHDSNDEANGEAARNDEANGETARDDEDALTMTRRARWLALAFVPSSLMLGVTTFISTDIASIPLLWVAPLSLYLSTLVIAFSRRKTNRRRRVELFVPGVALVFLLAYLSGATQPVWFLVAIHLVFFFVAALMCHGRLADDRPAPAHLAEFYLWVAAGGALGGLFNAVVAPLVFDRVVEYPLAVVAACALVPRRASSSNGESRARWLDFGYGAALGVLTMLLALLVARADWSALGVEWTTQESLAVVFGVPLLLAYLTRKRPLRFALALGAITLGGAFHRSLDSRTLLTARNFFGTLRVTQDTGSDLRWLYHGTTIHGRQSTALAKQCEPLSYYHPSGPLGDAFEAFRARPASPNVAVVGLGAGTTAAYARAGESWTFYEINPEVVHVAETPDYFTYLSYCARDVPISISLGDARLRLADAPGSAYGLIVLDAFSSDAIPVHLMTVEALDLYLSKLAPGGLVLFHISNRSLNLHPVVANLARSRNLSALARDDANERPYDADKEASQWIAVARTADDLASLAKAAGWYRLEGDPARRVWTDDYSNIISTFKLR